jgi:hypothetical protein
MITRRTPLTRSPIKRRATKRKPEFVNVVYRERVREHGCAISAFGTTVHALEHFCDLPISIHHVRKYGSPKDDRRILPLCASGHLHDCGPHSIERGKRQFEAWWGLDIEDSASRLWEVYG